MPSPLPRSSSSPNWREFLCFHNGGRARPARLPAPLPPSLPTPETQAAASRAHTALRFPQSLRAWADAGARARLLLLSIVTASSFHPRSLPLILCRRREHSGGGRHCGEERRRPPSSPPSIYNTMYVRLLLPRLSSSSPLFSPALSDTLPILTRPRISGKRASSRGYALRLYSLPRDDKRRSGSLPLSHLISVFPREERVEEAVRTGQATRNKDRGNQIGTKAKGTIARTFDFVS